MKRILSVFVLVIAISFQTNAQERKRQHRQGHVQDLTAEQMATLGSKKMTLKLDLTESQEKQVYQLLTAQAKDKISMRAQRQEMNANDKKPSDEAKYNFQVAHLDKQIAFKNDMKKVLNEEQFEKWSKTLDRRNHTKNGSQKGKRNNRKRSR